MGNLETGHLTKRSATTWIQGSMRCPSGLSSCATLLRLLAIIGCTLLAVQQTVAAASNTQYRINNTAPGTSGGIRFHDLLSDEEAVEILQSAKQFILMSFNLSQEIKSVYRHTLFVDVYDGVAYTQSDPNLACAFETHLSEGYVGDVFPNDTAGWQAGWLNEVTGVLVHESTHVWQNNNGDYGGDPSFTGIIEGMADYIRLKSEHPAATWLREAGGNWSDGYSTTAYFFEWIETTLVPNFVNKLNAKMVDPWTPDYFRDLTGKDVNQLWTAYQAFLATDPAAITTFHINNTALDTCGGLRFDVDLGEENILQVLRLAKSFIVQQFSLSKALPFSDLTLFVDSMTGIAFTYPGTPGPGGSLPEIHLSASYVDESSVGDHVDSYGITGVLVHESTHAWQNFNGSYGVDPVFTGVIEGIADFIRLRAQYPATDWIREPGGTWYAGYSTTAFFFDWIDTTVVHGFVNQLNHKMAALWNVSFIQEITGSSANDLWDTYQDFLLNGSPRPSPSSDSDYLAPRSS